MGFLYSQLFVTPSYPRKAFTGETVIVTGSNVGLGKEAVRHLVRLNAAKVILAVRNTKAGEEARQEIAAQTGRDPDVMEVWALDLSSSESVKAFAKRASALERLDAVIENAGIATGKFDVAEGYERTIKVNVISTFLLALLLLPTLKSTAKRFNVQTRLSIVSSEVHGWTPFKEQSEPNVFDALNDMTKSSMKDRYPVSKLLEVLVVRKLAPMLTNSGVTLNMINPGLCHSELGREAGFFFQVMKFFIARTTEVGSRNLIAGVSLLEKSHGAYVSDGKVSNEDLSPFVESQAGKQASDKVWKELHEILTRIQPDITV